MELRLLGAVEAHEGGQPVELGPRQQRLVLAVLALEVNTLVPVERLVELVWPGSPPRTAVNAVRTYVSKLRVLLDGRDLDISVEETGYVLRGDPARVDVHRFLALVERARSAEDEDKARLLGQALALWGGPPPVGDFDEIRRTAVEDLMDARLRLGRHADVVDELAELVDEHPGRERLVRQLMLALYRGGQASQALEIGRRIRELGIEPGEELRQLELDILRNDPGLKPPVVAAKVLVPAQLPPLPGDFTGREADLACLDEMAPEGAAAISAISGTAGVGKTALAVTWAHRVRERFPDGQLHVDLRGYAPGPPLRPEQVLAQFLRALGMPAEQIPVDADEASGTYRTLLADKRILVLLDNAGSAGQVRPLLPSGVGCVVVVTSRDRLEGLVATDSARRLALDVLPHDEAVALLTTMLGRTRIVAERVAVAELATACARLPLALRIAAAHLAENPHRRIDDYLAELRENPLAELSVDGDEEGAVHTAFGLSYAVLKPDARRAFRLLGLNPGPDVSVESAAALLDQLPGATRRLLARLASRHLIDQVSPGRYSFHDLLRAYAGARAREEDGTQTCTAAEKRLFEHYLDCASAAADVLYPQVLRVPYTPSGPVKPFDSQASAGEWLDDERPNLLAAVQNGPGWLAWRLGDVLRGYFYFRRRFADWVPVAQAAIAAAADEPQGLAAAHLSLGLAYYSVSQYSQAVEQNTLALRLAVEAGWEHGEIGAQNNLAIVDHVRGNLDSAAERHRLAMVLQQRIGPDDHEQIALINLGKIDEQRGKLDEAAEWFSQSLAVCQANGSRHGEATSLEFHGYNAFLRGEFGLAEDQCAQALKVYREIGTVNDEAHTLTHLALIHNALGRSDKALETAEAALALATDAGDRRTEISARLSLGVVVRDPWAAVDQYERALGIAREIGARYEETEALIGVAALYRVVGLPDHALTHARHAVQLAGDAGFRLLEAQARAVL